MTVHPTPESNTVARDAARVGGAIASRVLADISAALRLGKRPWSQPWDAPPFPLPQRANGELYRGINTLALWTIGAGRGYASPRWYTYRQAQALDAPVRKGERGALVIYYAPATPNDAAASSRHAPTTAPATDTPRYRGAVLRGYTVFNADQLDHHPAGATPPPAAPARPDDPALAAMFARVPAVVRYGGDQAFYAPAPDFIQLPSRAAFRDNGRFYATLAHELAHWTGHPTRLARDFGRYGDHSYALEELTAELAAAFLGAHIGLPADHIDDHSAYIGHWLRVAETVPHAFLTAAGRAQAAADYLCVAMAPLAST